MKTLLKIVLITALFALTGCDNLPFGKLHEAREVVRQDLFDPDSAKFRNMHAIDDLNYVCGEVNAKNRYGAYTGYRKFVFDSKALDPVKVLFEQEEFESQLGEALWKLKAIACF